MDQKLFLLSNVLLELEWLVLFLCFIIFASSWVGSSVVLGIDFWTYQPVPGIGFPFFSHSLPPSWRRNIEKGFLL
jgi:hypothetical protein